MTLNDLAIARREAFLRAEQLGVELGQMLRDERDAGRTLRQLVAETGYSRRQLYNLMEKGHYTADIDAEDLMPGDRIRVPLENATVRATGAAPKAGTPGAVRAS